MPGRSVLLVEDDDSLRESARFVLELEGYAVAEAVNGAEALRYLRSVAPHELPRCIVLDLMMPVMDGKSFLRALATEFKELARINILIWTAKGGMPDETFDFPRRLEVVQKAGDVVELLSAVERHCGSPDRVGGVF